MGKYRSMFNTHSPNFLTEDDFVWLYSAIKRSIGCVKNIKCKSRDELDGEIFTHLRGIYTCEKNEVHKNSAIHCLFSGRKKGIWF